MSPEQEDQQKDLETAYVSKVTPPIYTTHSASKGFGKEVPAIPKRRVFS